MDGVPRRLAALLVATFSLSLAACGGRSSTLPTTPPASGSTNETAFFCPYSPPANAASALVAPASSAIARHPASRGNPAQSAVPGEIAVIYRDTSASGSAMRSVLSAREKTLGATLLRAIAFPHLGESADVLSVAPDGTSTLESALSAQPGVVEVGPTGGRLHTTSVSQRYFTSNPYFNGFQTTVATDGTPPPSTYHVAPFDESATVPGQWDKHAIGLDYAFAYSQSGNGSGIVNPNALGAPSIKIAMIDTGQDTTHPLLASKIAYQRCFITDANGVQSTSNVTTDPIGHGTDTAGIAAADDNLNLGFSGSAGNSAIYGYRVFPTPDDSCSGSSPDQQCIAAVSDVAAAIVDAVSQNVNVINMSLSLPSGCTNGASPDTLLGAPSPKPSRRTSSSSHQRETTERRISPHRRARPGSSPWERRHSTTERRRSMCSVVLPVRLSRRGSRELQRLGNRRARRRPQRRDG